MTVLFTLVMSGVAPGQERPLEPDPPHVCDACEGWNRPQQPFRVFGNTYYVGTAGLSSVLIVSDDGHILLDGGLTQSASLIDANIRALGFRTADVRLILASHEHFDHVGGIAALQRASGAAVVASQEAVRALEAGMPNPDDPQYAFGPQSMGFPPVRNVRAVADGETLRVGLLKVTAHRTPGHTPGGTTWTWRSCDEGRCLDVVFADSLNPISAEGFRFSDTPGRIEAFKASIARVRSLPCDILLSVHPGNAGLSRKLEERAKGSSPDPFIDADACTAYADAAAGWLSKRIEQERSRAQAVPPIVFEE